MGWIAWIVLGLIAGFIAKAILKDRAPGGIVATLIVGVLGAVLGGWLGGLLLKTGLGDLTDIRTWLLAIGGSLLVLVIYGALSGRGSKRA